MRDEPEAWQKPENWQSAAMAAAIITIVCCSFAVPWVLEGEPDRIMLYRVQIVGSGAAVGLAAVTFFTVIWRGLISVRQAELQAKQVEIQAKQIEKLSEQISATEDNNLIALLQKGAEFVVKDESTYRAAGIASLRAVAGAKHGRFAVEALNLIADYVGTNHANDHSGPLFNSAAAGLADGERIGRRAERELRFEGTEFSTEPVWKPILGVSSAKYVGGSIVDWSLNRDQVKNHLFTCVVFNDVIVEIDRIFQGCVFNRCNVRYIDDVGMKFNYFNNCDFSDGQIDAHLVLPVLKHSGNFFYTNRAPRGVPLLALESTLNIRKSFG